MQIYHCLQVGLKGVCDGRPRSRARWDVNSNCAGCLYYSKVEVYSRGEPLSLSILTQCMQSPPPLNFRCTNQQFYKHKFGKLQTDVRLQSTCRQSEIQQVSPDHQQKTTTKDPLPSPCSCRLLSPSPQKPPTTTTRTKQSRNRRKDKGTRTQRERYVDTVAQGYDRAAKRFDIKRGGSANLS